jgi:hypothetical protein
MKLGDIACSDAREGARVAGLLWQTAQFCSKTVTGASCVAWFTWGKAGSDATSKHVETKTNMHRIRVRFVIECCLSFEGFGQQPATIVQKNFLYRWRPLRSEGNAMDKESQFRSAEIDMTKPAPAYEISRKA